MIDTVVIPAAGLGTRFYPITKGFPKEMLPIIDTPTLFYILEECLLANIKNVILIISKQKESIKKYFDNDEISQKLNIIYVYQSEQKGLGHAILMAKEVLEGRDFGVILGDDLYDCKVPAIKQLIDHFKVIKSSIIGTMYVSDNERSLYGMIDFDKKINDNLFIVKSMLEKPQVHETNSNLAASGRYILTNDIFAYLESQVPGKGGEIQLTDALIRLNNDKEVYASLIDGIRFDIGSKIGYLSALVYYGLKRDDLKRDFKEVLTKHVK